ncbi:hypothetical protein ACFLZ8_06120, partial [Planctomycetota bacterium]
MLNFLNKKEGLLYFSEFSVLCSLFSVCSVADFEKTKPIMCVLSIAYTFGTNCVLRREIKKQTQFYFRYQSF